MKTKWIVGWVLACALAGAAHAAQVGRITWSEPDETSAGVQGVTGPIVGFQLALFTPVQIFPERYNVYGLRLNLLYGRNANLRGFDLGIANAVNEDFAGLQLGAYNYAHSAYQGCAQVGVVNHTDSFQGLQFGAVNISGQASGLQLGVFNMCRSINGIQLGLLNFITESEFLVFCPLFNAQF